MRHLLVFVWMLALPMLASAGDSMQKTAAKRAEAKISAVRQQNKGFGELVSIWQVQEQTPDSGKTPVSGLTQPGITLPARPGLKKSGEEVRAEGLSACGFHHYPAHAFW